MSFPIKNGGSFHSYVTVYQRVSHCYLIVIPFISRCYPFIFHHFPTKTSSHFEKNINIIPVLSSHWFSIVMLVYQRVCIYVYMYVYIYIYNNVHDLQTYIYIYNYIYNRHFPMVFQTYYKYLWLVSLPSELCPSPCRSWKANWERSGGSLDGTFPRCENRDWNLTWAIKKTLVNWLL